MRASKIKLFWFTLIISLVCSASALAETKEVSFRIFSARKIVSATSTLFSTNGQELGKSDSVSIEKIGDSEWEIRVSPPPTSLGKSAKIAILALDEDGNIIPSAVKWLDPSQRVVTQKEGSCVSRGDISEIEKLFKLDQEALKTLADIRTTKAKVLEQKLRKLLTPAALNTIHSLEKSYGLDSSQLLTPNASIDEIVSRLARLQALAGKP